MAAVECPRMVARIFLIRKFGAAAPPFQSHSVFGHGAYMEHTSPRRTRPKAPRWAASLYLDPRPPPPDVDQSRRGRRERIDVDGPRAAQETAEPIRQHGHQPRAQRIAELRYARLEDDRLRRQALLVLAHHKQHPGPARGSRRNHCRLARS